MVLIKGRVRAGDECVCCGREQQVTEGVCGVFYAGTLTDVMWSQAV